MKKPSVIGPLGWFVLALALVAAGVIVAVVTNRVWIVRTYESYTKAYPVPKSEPARQPRQLVARGKPAAQIRPPPIAAGAPPPARSTACVQSSDHRWRYFGKAPFASSREEGMANREAALRCLGLPSAVVAAVMEATKHPAEKTIRLAKGDRVAAMASRPTTGPRKGDILVERRVLVDFVSTGTRGIGFYATVEVWSVSVNGTIYTIGLPEVCQNWLVVSIKPAAPRKKVVRVVPVIPPPQCVEVHLTVPAGTLRSVRFTTYRREAIQDFNCWGVIERSWRTGSPNNCDWCEWTKDGIGLMEQKYGGTFNFFHTSIYQLHQRVDGKGEGETTPVVLVFPPEARDGGIGVCVEVDGIIYTAALIMPSTWKGAGSVSIPADYWQHPRVVD